MELFEEAAKTMTWEYPLVEKLIAAAPVALPSSHGLFRCIPRVIATQLPAQASAGTTTNPPQSVAHAAIKLLSKMAREKCNRDACWRCILSVGGTMEVLLQRTLPPRLTPGTNPDYSNNIHVDVLVLLTLVSGHTIDAGQVLELYNHNVKLSVEALVGLLLYCSEAHSLSTLALAPDAPATGQWREPALLISAALRCLYEMTTWCTYKTALAATSETDINMATLQQGFTKHITVLNETIMNSPFLAVTSELLEDWIDSLNNAEREDFVHNELGPQLEAALGNLLLFITNLFSFTSDFTSKFRAYAIRGFPPSRLSAHRGKRRINKYNIMFNNQGTEGGIVERVILPMVLYEFERLETGTEGEAALARSALMLQQLLKVLSLLTYRTPMYRPTLSQVRIRNPNGPDGSLCARLIECRPLLQSDMCVEYVALIVRLCVNADLGSDRNDNAGGNDAVGAILRVHTTVLTDQQRTLLALRLCNPAEQLYPIDVFSGTYHQLKAVFAVPKDAKEYVHQSTAAAQFSFFGRGQQGDAKADAAELFTVTKVRGGGVSEKLRRRREALRRRRKMNRRRLIVASSKPADQDADVFEDAEYDGEEDDLEGSDPEAGEEMTDMGAAGKTVEVTIDGKSVKQSVVLVEDTYDPTLPDVVWVSRPTEPLPVEEKQPTPALAPIEEPKGPATFFDVSAFRKPAPFGCPDRYLCALSRQIMSIPVIAPSGEVYDKESILSFIRTPGPHKNRDPISGQPLYAGDLVVDSKLQREIMAIRGNYY